MALPVSSSFASGALAELRAAKKRSAALVKALVAVGKEPVELGALRAAVALVASELAELAKLRTALESVQNQAAGLAAELGRNQKFGFAKELADAMKAHGVEPRKIGDDPPEYRVGKLTLTVDFEADKTSLAYASYPLPDGVATTQGPAMAAAWQKCMAVLAKNATDAEKFAVALDSGYRALLGRSGAAYGSRVELAELHGEVAFALRPKVLTAGGKSVIAYDKLAFSFDLARLRQGGKLGQGGQRMSFTSATAGSAFKKDRVLYIADDSGAGQYYLSFQMITTARPEGLPQ